MTDSERECTVIITGFGKFSGVHENPTEKIVMSLKNEGYLAATNLTVIEVSSKAVEEYQELMKKSFSYPKLIIHLGVHPSLNSFALESCAYNNKTFRTPDQEGYQPGNECISFDQDFDDKTSTHLPLNEIADALSTQGFPVTISDDPGRFLCNYVYYRSLTGQFYNGQIRSALFVHVPPFEIIPYELQIQFVKSLVGIVTDCVNNLLQNDRIM